MLSPVQIRMQLPETIEMVVNARVSDTQSTTHVWVELLELDSEWQAQLAHLIEFARRQSGTSRSGSTFASSLLDASPSLPASEVGRRLSMGPPDPGSARSPASPPDATHASRTNLPAVRPLSQPLAPSTTRISRTNLPAVRPLSQPLNTHASRTNLPAVRPLSQPLAPSTTRISRTNLPAVHPQSQPAPSATSTSRTKLPAANAPSPPTRSTPDVPPRPTDPLELKRLLTEVAHKRYDAAIKVAQEMLRGNPGDVQAERWQNACLARLALARHEPSVACKHYEQVLLIDPNDREAREFVRTHRRDEKLNALPFGRFFTKPKGKP